MIARRLHSHPSAATTSVEVTTMTLQERIVVTIALGVCVLSVVVSCSGSSAEGSPLQSECVQKNVRTSRTTADGVKCTNVGYGDCGDVVASNCVNVCAHDLCQAAECQGSEDCSRFRGSTCQDYVVDGKTFGKYCKPADKPSSPNDTCSGCGGVFCSGDCIGCPGC
jgi:hypothetical protein